MKEIPPPARKDDGNTARRKTDSEEIEVKRMTTNRLIAPENLFAAVYFFLFAVILLSSDPEWLMWAGPITLGAFPVDAAPSLSFDPLVAFRAAAGGVFLGLLALAVLLTAAGSLSPHDATLRKTTHAAIPGKP